MPSSLVLQILNHDSGQDYELSIDLVKDAVIGEVKAVRDVRGYPCYEERSLISIRILSLE